MNAPKVKLQSVPGVLQSYPVADQMAREFGSRTVTLSDGRSGLRDAMLVQVKAVEGAPPEEMDFIASDASLDRWDEVIDQAGWDLTHYRKNPVVVDSHDYGSISRIIGQSLSTEVRDGRLINRVKFATQNPLGKLAFELARGGFLRSESVGFIPIEWKSGDRDKDEPRRTYTKQELIEISLVAVPANPGATVGLAVKSGAVSRDTLRAVIDELRQVADLSNKESRTADPSDRGRAADWSQLAQRITNLAALVRQTQ